MSSPLQQLACYQMLWTRQWLMTLVAVTDAYLSVLDPRPDLANRARDQKAPFAWWW